MKQRTKQTLGGVGIVVGLASAFALGFVKGCAKEAKKAKDATPKQEKVPVEKEPKQESERVEVEVIKEVPIVEKPSMEGIFEGTWKVKPTGDEDFDDLMQKGVNLMNEIEECSFDLSEKQETFEDISFSILSGMYTYKDDMEEQKGELFSMAERAVAAYERELEKFNEGTRIPYIVTSKAVRKHRDDLYKYCKDIISYKEETETN